MKKLLIVSLIIISIAMVFIFKSRNTPKSVILENDASLKSGTAVENIAPDFEATTYDGRVIRLSDYKGTPVFLNFWAAWCPFCVEELPLMADVQRANGDKYVTLAVNRGENLKTARKFSDGLNVADAVVFLLDENDDIYRRYGGFAMPYSLFLDSSGVIVDIKHGPLTREELEPKINKIIQ